MKMTKILCIATTFFLFSAQALFSSPNIILFGLPGAGKGTLSQKLIEKYQYAHICPGNLLRAEVRNKSDFGKAIEPILTKGDYVPEKDTFTFLKSKIMEAHTKNFPLILDGYPRSVEALHFLDPLLGYQVLEVDVDNDPGEIFKHVCKIIDSQSTEEDTKPKMLSKNVSIDSEKLDQLFFKD